MINIHIGNSERSLEVAGANWINEQVNHRRVGKQTVCVRIVVEEMGINVMLTTPGCDPSDGGTRKPNSQEFRHGGRILTFGFQA
jgi:hypothetical protein